MKPKFDYLHREVQRAAGPAAHPAAGPRPGRAWRCSRRPAAAPRRASAAPAARPRSANPLAGKPLENHLEIYNWSQYDDPSTYTKFKELPAEAKAGLKVHETYYSSATTSCWPSCNAGGTTYDIIAPSQNAVAELIQEKKLMALDHGAAAQPEEPRPVVPQAVVRPDRRVPRHQGLRHHDVLLQQQDRHRAAEDHARLLQACCRSTSARAGPTCSTVPRRSCRSR